MHDTVGAMVRSGLLPAEQMVFDFNGSRPYRQKGVVHANSNYVGSFRPSTTETYDLIDGQLVILTLSRGKGIQPYSVASTDSPTVLSQFRGYFDTGVPPHTIDAVLGEMFPEGCLTSPLFAYDLGAEIPIYSHLNEKETYVSSGRRDTPVERHPDLLIPVYLQAGMEKGAWDARVVYSNGMEFFDKFYSDQRKGTWNRSLFCQFSEGKMPWRFHGYVSGNLTFENPFLS